MIVVLAMMTMFVIVYNYFRKQKVSMQNEIILVKEIHERTMLSTQLEIQEQTFGHISREIHDHVGQRLTLARFYLSSLKEKDTAGVISLAESASQLIGEAITDLKQLSRSLTSSVIEDNGLLYALEQEIERISRLVSWKLTLQVNGDSKFISTDSELIIFRIVQEALQNIIKYADPQEVRITFNFLRKQVTLTIQDDGKGFDPIQVKQNPGSKSGLANMKKRSSLLAGSMDLQSSPGAGTKLSFIFPLNHTYA